MYGFLIEMVGKITDLRFLWDTGRGLLEIVTTPLKPVIEILLGFINEYVDLSCVRACVRVRVRARAFTAAFLKRVLHRIAPRTGSLRP